MTSSFLISQYRNLKKVASSGSPLQPFSESLDCFADTIADKNFEPQGPRSLPEVSCLRLGGGGGVLAMKLNLKNEAPAAEDDIICP